MIDGLPPSQQALYGTLFTWFVTALGSGVVFVEPLLPGSHAAHQLFLDTMLGFAGGVMIAASYWSLLAPGALPISRRALVCAPPIDRCVCVSSGHACLSVPAIAMAEQDWYGKTKFAQIDLSNGISKEVTYAPAPMPPRGRAVASLTTPKWPVGAPVPRACAPACKPVHWAPSGAGRSC